MLLFGATNGPGDIAVVVVRGPAEDAVIRRKGRAGPIWVNAEQITWRDVPSYYRVASSRPLDDFAPPSLLSRYQIGIENIRMVPEQQNVAPDMVTTFRQNFVRLKTEASLYDQALGSVNLMSNRLFRTELHFPANVPTGTYLVEVYLFREGNVAAAEIVPLNISQIGVSADIVDFAHNLAPLYGLLSVLLAGPSAGSRASSSTEPRRR